MFKLFSFLLLIAAMSTAVHATCVPSAEDNDIENYFCKIGDYPLVGTAVGICRNVNGENPFDYVTELCVNKIKEDGADCAELVAEWQCSLACAECDGGGNPKLVCNDVCQDVIKKCPIAQAAGCMNTLFSQCEAEGDDECTSLSVSRSKVLDVIGLGDDDDGNSAQTTTIAVATLMTVFVFFIALI